MQVWDLKGLDPEADKPAKMRVTAAVAAHDKDINAVAVAPNDSGGWPGARAGPAVASASFLRLLAWLLACMLPCAGSGSRGGAAACMPSCVLCPCPRYSPPPVPPTPFSPQSSAPAARTARPRCGACPTWSWG